MAVFRLLNVLSTFSSNLFLSRYSSILSIMLLILSSSSENNTISSVYTSVYTFLSPNQIPPHFTLPISSSRSAITMLNSNGLSGHPCLTPLAVQKLSPVFPPALTILFVSLNTSFTLSISPSLIPLSLIALYRTPLSTESNAALRSTNSATTFFPIPNCLFTK
ncbi:hypothetical protein ALC57_14860 [Trachymyrmex cornetzi]|uniref:Uncharacterized protein n=1 Tax=Trachymyrmex cornetzi TaxID=471704 RepID=A0A151IXQ3_9HYME|nr:hypothetical protein ALC57_14860 [Trachymyrmex cornetzi]